MTEWLRIIERLLVYIAEETPELVERGVLVEAEKDSPHTIFLTVSGAETDIDVHDLIEAAHVACDRFRGELGTARIKARYVAREELADVLIRHWDLLLDVRGALENGRPALVYTLGRSGNNPADLGAGYFYE